MECKGTCKNCTVLNVVYRKTLGGGIVIFGLVTNKWLKENKKYLKDFRVKKNAQVMIVPKNVFIEDGVML